MNDLRERTSALEAELVERVRRSVRDLPFTESTATTVELVGRCPDTEIVVRGKRPNDETWEVSYSVWKDGFADPAVPRLDVRMLDAMVFADVLEVA